MLNRKMIFVYFLLAITGLVSGLDNTINGYSASNNKLTLNLYKELSGKSLGNLIYSPLSVQLSLMLANFGAKGETAAELQRLLNLPKDAKDLKASLKRLQSELETGTSYILNNVNKAYVKTDYSIKSSFSKAIQDIFSADIERINFNDREAASKKINQYVEEKTAGELKTLIQPDQLSDLTRLILINAIYFKANWSRPFDESQTKLGKFSKSSKESLELPIMTATDYFKYGELPELKARILQIPYVDDDTYLSIVLPNDIDGLQKLDSDPTKVFQLRNLTYTRVQLKFPKFSIDSYLKVRTALKNLGISRLFDESKADLTNIADSKPALYVDDVVQAAKIKFTESGTTAAAATAVLVGIPFSSLPPPDPVQFSVDRPFIFYLVAKNFIIFAGRVFAPTV